MQSFLHSTRYLASHTNPQKLGVSKAEVAFVGRSNVGKSSLLNAVCRTRQLARTSKTPGRTRAINVFLVRDGRWIVDLPGYGFATGPQEERAGWRFMIEGYLTGRPNLRAVFVLIDAKVGPTELDRQMLDWLQHQGILPCVVANKTDKVPQPDAPARRAEVAHALGMRPEDIFWVSAAKGTGIAELEKAISAMLLKDPC
jgi:GTP-binding protein